MTCSPKLKITLEKTLPPLTDNSLVVVLDIADDQLISGQ
jgi:hypothetical protein